jgi:phosphatidylglycerophosphate synthase
MTQVSPRRAQSLPGDGIAAVYRATLKSTDLAFNVYVCRPLAAVFVHLLRDTRIAPNQVTFFSLALALVAAALLLGLPWPLGLWVGVGLYELSYVFDKVDGMLARLRGVASPSGHLLDFLMDEIKALLMLAALSVGAYLSSGRIDFLFWGMAGLVCLASGVGMTAFQRRPEVAPERAVRADGAPGKGATDSPPARRGLVRGSIALAERVGRFFVHYPSYVWLAAVLGDVRWYLYPYVVANALYAARALSSLAWRFGRFAERPPPA